MINITLDRTYLQPEGESWHWFVMKHPTTPHLQKNVPDKVERWRSSSTNNYCTKQRSADCVQWHTDTTVWHNDHTLQLSWQSCDAEFYVSSSMGPAILGLRSCRELRLVEINCEVTETLNRPNFEAHVASNSDLVIIDAYSDRFEGIGSFWGEFHITIDRSVPPSFIHHADVPYTWRTKSRQSLIKWRNSES